MNWEAITTRVNAVKTSGTDLQKRLRGLRHRLTLLLAVIGPGLITSNVDNDAGGISVYTQAGAQYGYTLLWALIPMTIALYVTEEMCARMAVVTGKAFSCVASLSRLAASIVRGFPVASQPMSGRKTSARRHRKLRPRSDLSPLNFTCRSTSSNSRSGKESCA